MNRVLSEWGTTWMTSDRPEFDVLAKQTAAALNLKVEDIHRDYWVTRCLYALAVKTHNGLHLFPGHRNRRLAGVNCAFGGGTSLVSAWDISQRYSSDLDLLCLMQVEGTHDHLLARPHDEVTTILRQACGWWTAQLAERDLPAARFRETTLETQSPQAIVRADSSVEASDDSLVAPCRVMSLMGRFATVEQLARFPELGGFEFLCVMPAYTAANKFDAMHRRERRLDGPKGLRERGGRDLYDLHQIADSSHADEVRLRIPELWQRASDSETRAIVVRPTGGYGYSDVFALGTKANKALRQSYEMIVETVWGGGAPSFEVAVEAAASLDRH